METSRCLFRHRLPVAAGLAIAIVIFLCSPVARGEAAPNEKPPATASVYAKWHNGPGQDAALPHRRLAARSPQRAQVPGHRHQSLRRLVARADRRADRRTEAARHAGHLRPERLRPEASRRKDHRRLDARRRAGQRPVAAQRQGLRPADPAGEDRPGLPQDQGERSRAGR